MNTIHSHLETCILLRENWKNFYQKTNQTLSVIHKLLLRRINFFGVILYILISDHDGERKQIRRI